MIRRRLISFVLVTGALAVFLVGCQSSSAVPAVKPLPGQRGTLAHRPPAHLDQLGIRVVKGFGEFYDKDGGATFVPRGNNYIRLARVDGFTGSSLVYHTTFNVGLYDSTRSEDALSQMEALGYNVVRVYLNGITFGSMYMSSSGPLSAAYMANVADFLRRAKSHGIRTILTTDFAAGQASHVTNNPAFHNNNGDFLTAEGITSEKLFWSDVVDGLRSQGGPLDDVFSFELRGELSFNTTLPPFAASVSPAFTPGLVTTGDGMTYDTSQPNQWRPMMDSNLVNWANNVTDHIKRIAPHVFVAIGFFSPNEPNPWRDTARLAYPYPALSSSEIDYIKLSLYTNTLTLPQFATNLSLNGNQVKPAVMGETGALIGQYTNQQAASKLLNWQLDSCMQLHIKGWLLWTWDTELAEQPAGDGPWWTAVDPNGNGLINSALAPAARPDPCAP